MIKRISVLTSGGDAPGMNAVIHSIVKYGMHHKIEVIGISRGYGGLINEDLKPLDHRSVSGIINRGGTILETARCDEFLTEEGQRKAVEVLKRNKIDALVVIGGDGTYRGAIQLWEQWHIPCVGVPATIDNDINGTDITIGVDTAISNALGVIDKIQDTATSMKRIFVVEVMGRDTGFIAIHVALASGAENILIPESKYNLEEMCQDIAKDEIVVVAEGAAKADKVAEEITEITGLETRAVVLGYMQRGGNPTAQDRILAARLGAAAMDLILDGDFGKAVGIQGGKTNVVDLHLAVEVRKNENENRD